MNINLFVLVGGVFFLGILVGWVLRPQRTTNRARWADNHVSEATLAGILSAEGKKGRLDYE